MKNNGLPKMPSRPHRVWVWCAIGLILGFGGLCLIKLGTFGQLKEIILNPPNVPTSSSSVKTLTEPQIVALDVAHFNDLDKPYVNIQIIDLAGHKQSLDRIFGKDGTNPNTISLVDNTFAYIKNSQVLAYRVGDTVAKRITSLTTAVKTDEQLNAFAVSPDRSTVYLWLSPKEAQDSLTLARVDQNGRRTDILTSQDIKFALFSHPVTVGTNSLVFSAGYGDAGAETNSTYVVNLESKTLTKLIDAGSDAYPFGGATGNTHQSYNLFERAIVMDNLNYTSKHKHPTNRNDFDQLSDSGSATFYNDSGITKTIKIDFSPFLTISHAAPMIKDQPESTDNPAQSFIDTALNNVFIQGGIIYASVSKPTTSDYWDATNHDGTYRLEDSTWKAIDTTIYRKAYEAFLATGSETNQLDANVTITDYENSPTHRSGLFKHNQVLDKYQMFVSGEFIFEGILRP